MLRHGETIGNLTKITAGSTNHSLTSNGKLQAREVAKIFNKLDLINIIFYTSDLQRSVETASIINKNRYETIIIPELRERSFGSWEGIEWEQVKERLIKGKEPINGETLQNYVDRLYSAFNKILSSNSNIVPFIVSHKGSFLALGKIFNYELVRDINNCELFYFVPIEYVQNNTFPWEIMKVTFQDNKLFYVKEKIYKIKS